MKKGGETVIGRGRFFLFFLEEREHKGKWGEPKTKWRIKILKKKTVRGKKQRRRKEKREGGEDI